VGLGGKWEEQEEAKLTFLPGKDCYHLQLFANQKQLRKRRIYEAPPYVMLTSV
jgi:hypothetical protein